MQFWKLVMLIMFQNCQNDCSGGEDEEGCVRYASLFSVEPGFKLASSEEV